jgi:hypothetical protein
MLQWKTACEAEMSKRDIQFHDVGHGWTVAPFGVNTFHGWKAIDDNDLSDDAKKYLALYKGKRSLYNGIALNTQFCMSSPEARKMVAEHIADYAKAHSNVDYIHVWLGDGKNNHCECEECAKKTVSDWYMMLLNDIDAALPAKSLNTRIVFIQYTETTWAPLTERINNPDRFTMMLAPISRDYTRTLTDQKPVLPPFVRNNITLPTDLNEYMAHYKEWRKVWNGACLCFEYHFWRHQMLEPSGLLLAKRIFEDIECYKANDIDGLIACGSQRSYFPTGFAYYVFARKQFDLSLSYEELLEEYFSCAFGEDWRLFYDYLDKIGSLFDVTYLEYKGSADRINVDFYFPEKAEELEGAEELFRIGEELVKSHYNSDYRIRTVSVRLLEAHLEYCRSLAKMLIIKARGDDEGAIACNEEFRKRFGRREAELELYYDHNLHFVRLGVVAKHPTRKDSLQKNDVDHTVI